MHLQRRSSLAALVLAEVLVIIVLLVVVVALVVAVLAKSRVRGRMACCNCHLKQVGLAFRLYSNDHGDHFPWYVPKEAGGTSNTVSASEMFRHFLVASNELNTPKILTCPTDASRKEVSDWGTFSNTNVSYFIGVDADEGQNTAFLTGDRHISGGTLTNGFVMTMTPGKSIATWSRELHHGRDGNIGFGDGSVGIMSVASLQPLISTSAAPFRLALPELK